MPRKRLAGLLILGSLLALASSGSVVDASEVTVYPNDGFEPFRTGTIHDQNDWGVIGPLANAVIQDDPDRSKSKPKSLALTTGADVVYAYRLYHWSPEASGVPVVTLQAAIRPEAGDGWRWVYFYTDHHSYENPPGKGIVLNFGWGHAYAYEIPGGETAFLDLGPYVPGEWGELTITVDYRAQQYAVTWNGASTGFHNLVANAGASQFQGWSFGVQDAPITMYVDDVLVTAADSTTLRDVPSSHWASKEIYACFSAGVVTAYPDGTYHPALPVTRDQMAVFISRAVAGGDDNVPDGPPQATFDDVPADYWAYKYIEYCVANDIAEGYDPVTYGPDDAVSRDAMAAFISRAVAGGDANVPAGPTQATFDDVPTGHWAYKYVEYCVANDIVQGYDPVTYGPTITVSRDQMAVFICRAFDLPTD